jgi:hypothetical protein
MNDNENMGHTILEAQEIGGGDICTDASNSHQIHNIQRNHSKPK